MTTRGSYPHFMLKEIHEQPEVVAHTLLGRVASTRWISAMSWTGQQNR